MTTVGRPHAAAQLTVDPNLLRFGVHDAAGTEQVGCELLTLSGPSTATFAANNRISIGVLRALAAYRADHLELVGFDGVELGDRLAHPPTTVSYDAADQGREAAGLLANRLEGDARPPQRIVLQAELVVRGVEKVAA